MAQKDAWRAYVELALGLTETSRKKAMKIVQEVAGKGGATAEQLQELVTQGLANREAMTRMIRVELDRALGRVGLATMDEVEELNRRVRDLEGELYATRLAAGMPAGAEPGVDGVAPAATVAKKTVAKKAVAKKAVASGGPAKATTASTGPAKKATAKKATAKKSPAKKAPAKKSPARKTVAKKSVAKKSVAKKSVARKAPARSADAALATKTSANGASAARKAAPKRTSAKKTVAKKTVRKTSGNRS